MNPQPLNYREWNTFGELAAVWGVNTKTVRRWFREHARRLRLRVHRPSPRCIRISRGEAERFWRGVQAYWISAEERRELAADRKHKRR